MDVWICGYMAMLDMWMCGSMDMFAWIYGYVDILFIVKDKLNNTRKYNKNIKIYEAINGPRIYYNNNFVPNLFNIPLNITSPDIRYEILSDIVNFKSLNYDFNANIYKFYEYCIILIEIMFC